MMPEERQELFEFRRAATQTIPYIADKPIAVNEAMTLILNWTPGTMDNPVTYTQGVDVRMYGGNPYICSQTHTHYGEPDWDPEHYNAGWIQYHGTSMETARPYIYPQGAHDAYHNNEYMIWTDGDVWQSMINANTWTPVEYPQG